MGAFYKNRNLQKRLKIRNLSALTRVIKGVEGGRVPLISRGGVHAPAAADAIMLLRLLLGALAFGPPSVPFRRTRSARPVALRAPRIAMDGEVDPEFQKTLPNMMQAGAIRSASDAVLLLAPPGTGKTRVLRSRLAYLHGKGVPPSAILAVTFTQHAAQQLKQRVDAMTGSQMEGMWIGTFHSICARMLRAHAALLSLSPSFTVLIETEQIALLASLMQQVLPASLPRAHTPLVAGGAPQARARHACRSARRVFAVLGTSHRCRLTPLRPSAAAAPRLPLRCRCPPAAPPLPSQVNMRGSASAPSAAAILHRIQCWKESGLQPRDVPPARAPHPPPGGDDDVAVYARTLYPEYQRRLRTRGQLDYSDLTLGALKLFERYPHVLRAYRERFRHVVVDELQVSG